MEERRTIALKELLMYIFLKWRSMLCWAVVIAVLFGGIGYIKTYKNVAESSNQENGPDSSQYEKQLTDGEIAEVEEAVDNYETYEEAYTNYKQYNEKSLKMQIDANNVPTQKIIYRISDNQDIINIGDTYVELFPNSNVSQIVLENSDWEISPSYINELITVSNSHLDTIALNGQSISSATEMANENPLSVLLTIQIIADTKEHCNLIGNAVEEEIDALTTELQNEFGNFAIQKISSSFFQEANKDLLKEQQTSVSEMNNVSNLMRNIENSLSEEQRPYYLTLLNEKKVQLNEKKANSDNLSPISMFSLQYLNVKYIVLGIFAGVILSGGYFLCKFLFEKHLIAQSFIIDDLGYPVLEEFSDKSKRKKFGYRVDKWINTILGSDEKGTEEERLKLLCTKIQVYMQKEELKNICVTGTVKTEKTKFIEKTLEKEFERNGIKYCSVDSILHDAKALKSFVEMDGVVFIEQKGISLMKEIEQETKNCIKYDINNLGFIIAE